MSDETKSVNPNDSERGAAVAGQNSTAGGRPGYNAGQSDDRRGSGDNRHDGDRRRDSMAGGQRRYRRKVLDTRSLNISFDEPEVLERFISRTGKILPQRVTGASARIQRKIAREIRRARMISLLPFKR